ncbi:MAG: hydroxymethylbilane synthase [Thermoguttaceae bacterium]|jgi:hydroxymethylbilane synthase
MKPIRIGTRPSALALWQANWTRDALLAHGRDAEIVKITTSGDIKRHEAIVNLGAQGVFTKEIQGALLADEIDVAVHSLKDLPTERTPGLKLAATPMRADARDVFVSNKYATLAELPPGATLGTSSMRRKSMALRFCAKRRPNEAPWDVQNIRGNVETRLKKLDAGEYDALILAKAGLERLGLGDRATEVLEGPDFLPSVGQGALGLEVREDDLETTEQIRKLLHEPTWLAILAERAFLRKLQGGCLVPIGALGMKIEFDDGTELLALDAQILSFDGTQSFQTQSFQILRASAADRELPLETKEELATLLGRNAAENLLEQGAADVVAEIRKVRDERAARLAPPDREKRE